MDDVLYKGWRIVQEVNHEYDFTWVQYKTLRPEDDEIVARLRPGHSTLKLAKSYIDQCELKGIVPLPRKPRNRFSKLLEE